MKANFPVSNRHSFWNRTCHNCHQNSPLQYHILSYFNPIRILITYFIWSIVTAVSHILLTLSLHNWFLPMLHASLDFHNEYHMHHQVPHAPPKLCYVFIRFFNIIFTVHFFNNPQITHQPNALYFHFSFFNPYICFSPCNL